MFLNLSLCVCVCVCTCVCVCVCSPQLSMCTLPSALRLISLVMASPVVAVGNSYSSASLDVGSLTLFSVIMRYIL